MKTDMGMSAKKEDDSKLSGETDKTAQDIKTELSALDKFKQSGYDTGFVFHDE